MGAPLRAEAARLDEGGLERAAWLGRWMAGAEASFSIPPADELLAADPPEAELAAATPETSEGAQVDGEATNTDEPESEATDQSERPTDAEDERPEAEDAPEAELAEAEGPAVYSPAELFAAYAPAVVAINVGHGSFRSGGTGFFIDEAGTLATNHHVIDGAEELRVKLWDGTQIERVELLTSDAEADLALLRVDLGRLPKAPMPTILGDSETVEVGEPVSVIGNPLGLDHTLTNGIVSARRILHGERYIQMSAPISPGNSGGPVFDRHGRVIGVSVGGMVGGQNLNLAVPVSQLQALIADDYPERRSFGASSW
jgi:S1-C subfamily serine protease